MGGDRALADLRRLTEMICQPAPAAPQAGISRSWEGIRVHDCYCWRGCRPWLWTGPNCRIRDCAHGGRESAPGNGVQPVRIDVISRATAINNFVDIGPTAPSTGDLYVFSDDVFFTSDPAAKVG